jgi:mRNA-degrading endonuclease RelE of RelBE toxin-antitoxin system
VSDRYALLITGPARRHLAKSLPESVAVAVVEFITGPLLADPHRVTKPLGEPFEGQRTARRGEYRILCTIDDDALTVTVTAVAHRRDSYRRG